ncbi:MAG: hypothetical protein ACOYYS_14260 [Chloroflexota bacterium]
MEAFLVEVFLKDGNQKTISNSVTGVCKRFFFPGLRFCYGLFTEMATDSARQPLFWAEPRKSPPLPRCATRGSLNQTLTSRAHLWTFFGRSKSIMEILNVPGSNGIDGLPASVQRQMKLAFCRAGAATLTKY